MKATYKLSQEDSMQLIEIILESKRIKLKCKESELCLNEVETKILLDFLTESITKDHDWKVYLSEITETQGYSGLDFTRLILIEKEKKLKLKQEK